MCGRQITRYLGRASTLTQRGSGAGFTLVEVLLSMSILAAVLGIFTAVSITGLNTMSGQNSDRELNATSAQLVGMTFGRDVQGAASLSATSCGSDGTALVTLVPTFAPGTTVSWRSVPSGSTTSLVRTTCSGGSVTSTNVVTDDLVVTPTVTCDGGTCQPTTTPRPRTVTLRTGRQDSFAFRVSAARRSTSVATPPPILTSRLFAIGGTTPLSLSGNGALVVNGDAYVNSSSAAAVSVGGANARLTVNGTFKILQGGGCAGCNATKVIPFPPGSFTGALPDPLAYLPIPSESGMPTGSCSATKCTPGIYANRLSLTSSRTFDPGVYVLRKGIAVSGQAAISGSGVFLYNGCATGAPGSCAANQSTFDFSGQGAVQLTPPTSGRYQGILLFQSRTNTTTGSITGGAQASSYGGVLYVPNGSVNLGSGGGGLSLGAVVGRNLTIGGNGTVTVNG